MNLNLEFILNQKRALLGVLIVVVLCLLAVFAPILFPLDPLSRVGRPHQPPSGDFLMGTTKMGRDVFGQFIWGARSSLAIGFGAGILIVVIGTTVGLVSGYIGGKVDLVLDMITNVFLTIPQIPLLIVLAAFMGTLSPIAILLIIALTSWPWGARMTRAQTLAMKNRDFITAAKTVGEKDLRVIFCELMPNMLPLIGINVVGSVLYAVGAQTTLEFLGFGDALNVSWGTMLYNAQNSSALILGAWWEVLVPCAGLALLGLGLALVNFSLDEVVNPQLRAGRALRQWFALNKARNREIEGAK